MSRVPSLSSPFLLGFDEIERVLDRVTKAADGYPPYNIERVGPESFVYGTLDRGDGIIVRLPGTHAPAPGERAVALARRANLHVFTADGQRRLEASI